MRTVRQLGADSGFVTYISLLLYILFIVSISEVEKGVPGINCYKY